MLLSMADPLAQIDRKAFVAHLHTRFKVQTDGANPISLELDEVKDLPSPPTYDAFALVFRGPAHTRLPQQTHRFEHESLGSLDIFVTAIAGDAESIFYEAVFNRKRKPA
jgi:hypothetical protein